MLRLVVFGFSSGWSLLTSLWIMCLNVSFHLPFTKGISECWTMDTNFFFLFCRLLPFLSTRDMLVLKKYISYLATVLWYLLVFKINIEMPFFTCFIVLHYISWDTTIFIVLWAKNLVFKSDAISHFRVQTLLPVPKSNKHRGITES